MATAEFYVLLTPTFADAQKTKVKKLTASKVLQNRPSPVSDGLYIQCSIEVPDVVFGQLVPRLEAKVSAEQLEMMLMETSDLYMKVVGVDDGD